MTQTLMKLYILLSIHAKVANGTNPDGEEDNAYLPSQSRFWITVDEGVLAAALVETLYFEWSIVIDSMDIENKQHGLYGSTGDATIAEYI